MPAPQHDAPRGGFNFNMPWRITTGSKQVELEYDAAGARLIKRKRTAGNVSQVTLDIGELYRQVAQFSPGSSTPTSIQHAYRIYAGRQVVEVRREQTGSVIDTLHDKTYYLHDDIVGSSSVITNSDGSFAESRRYSSFGEDKTGIDYAATGVLSGFTGADQDDDLGLTNMRGRLYDPKLARFITPDPFVSRPDNAQGLNRYAYVENNPLKFVDPSGFESAFNAPSISGVSAPGLGLTVYSGSADGAKAAQAAAQADGAARQSAASADGAAGGAAAQQAGPGGPGAGPGRSPQTTADPTSAPGGQPGNWTAGHIGERALDALSVAGNVLARYVVVPAVEAVFGGNEAGGAVEGEAHLVHQSPLRQLAASATYFAVGAVAKFGAAKALGALGKAASKEITTLFHGSDAASVAKVVQNGLSKAAARELGGGDVFWATTDKGIATFFAGANPAGGAPAVAALQIPTSALQSLINSGAVAIDRTGAYMVNNWGAFNKAVISRAVAP